MAGFQLQMTWQTNLLKKRKNGPPLGFKNLGNTCYLNSVLQCLTYTPPLANFCLQLQHSLSCDSVAQQDKKSDCPFCLLEKRIVRSLSIDSTLDTPGKIISGLKIFAEHFRQGRQEDAHEFLRYVIDACHTTSLRLKKLQQQRRKYVSNGGGDGVSGSTVVKEIFGGALQSQVKCLTCGNESNKVDEIMDISVDVLNSSSLKEAFQKFFQPEILDGNNKWSEIETSYLCFCSCKKLVAARKQMSIVQAPNILVIQLKRFEGIFGGKIDKAIAFEEVLVLSSFMCKTSQDPHPEYKLFATIVHSGFSPDSGHYYAYIKDAIGRWYCCNDSYVSVSTLQQVFTEKVYILFFSRTKPPPPTTTNGISQTIKKSTPDSIPATSSSSSSIPGPQKKPNNTKKFPNMKIIVHNKENNNINNKDKNGISQNKPLANGNENGCKSSNGIRNGVAGDKSEVHGSNGGVAVPDNYKRKHEEQKHSKLLGEDHDSLTKREELKESLMKEASLYLRSCGWMDEVKSSMHAKKMCFRDELQQDELKKKLIGDAKGSFLSRIPEPLKTRLINHIRAHVDP
ncbi:hypothetical protein LXL04_037890 [Taraxacum kok-saghyz]